MDFPVAQKRCEVLTAFTGAQHKQGKVFNPKPKSKVRSLLLTLLFAYPTAIELRKASVFVLRSDFCLCIP